ncbi:hypothetical protein DRO58_05090 [Candidatus Bathyarchaeota archaeon]|nr:MAG: hypothetical protein DRO58_05090 [Candidatus Bathyarchaeota archaeon]
MSGGRKGLTLAERLAEFICSVDYEEIPEEVIERTKIFLLDFIGTTLIASINEFSKYCRELFLEFGGKPESSIIGDRENTSCLYASFINGFTPEIYDWTPDHRQLVHPSPLAIPPALALTEKRGLDGRTLIESVIVGFEVSCRVSEAFLGFQFYTPYPPVFTIFGSAASAAKSLSLNREETVMALGIAGCRGEGLQEWKAGDGLVKPLHVGFAAMNGTLSAILAERGFRGPKTVLEGRDGYLKAYAYKGRCDEEKIISGLGEEYRMMNTAFKPYPVCNPLQPVIENTLYIVKTNRIRWKEVKKVFVKVSSAGQNYPFDRSRYRPRTLVEAQFSIPYVVAASIVRGRFTHLELSRESLNDPDILEMASRIEGVEDPEYTETFLRDPSRIPVYISIRMKDGRDYDNFLDIPMGEPYNPRYEGKAQKFHEAIIDKFRSIVSRITPYKDLSDELIRLVMNLEKLEDIHELTDMLEEEPKEAK